MMQAAIEPRQFREALSHYASGLTVISTLHGGEAVGFTCQSFHSLSVTPPLVSFSVMRSSRSWPRIRAAGAFAVNILAADQQAIATRFAAASGDRWAGISWRPSPAGNPVLEGALLTLDCTPVAEHEAGDHWLIVAAVCGLAAPDAAAPCAPLLYYRGRYHELAGG